MFSTEGKKAESGFKPSKFIYIGPNELKITGITLFESNKNGVKRYQPNLNFETKPVLEKDFEGWEGAVGKIGRIPLCVYSTPEESGLKDDAINKLMLITEELGVRDLLDGIRGSQSVEEYYKKVSDIIVGKYSWWLIAGKEKIKPAKDDKKESIVVELTLPKFNFIAKTEAELLAKMKGGSWPNKETDGWFFKKLAKMDNEPNKPQDEGSGLPF